jgi:hypothetical protein
MYSPAYNTTLFYCTSGDGNSGYHDYGTWSVTQGASHGSLLDNGDGSATFTRTSSGDVTVHWTALLEQILNINTCSLRSQQHIKDFNPP